MIRISLLVASVIGNVALAAWLWPHFGKKEARAPEQAVATTPSPPASPPPVGWARLKGSASDADFVSALKADGFPEWAIRSLLRQRVYERYAPGFHALRRKGKVKPYWQTSQHSPYGGDAKTMAESRALGRQMQQEIAQVLGSGADEWGLSFMDDRQRFGPLPAEKITALKAVMTDYSDLAAQIRAEGGGGVILPEDREKLAFLDREQRADIERLLTPEELDQYDRRTSPAANTVRNRLIHLDATEEEFLKLYRLQKAFDDRYGARNLTGEQEDQRRDAQTALKAQFAEALGPERYEQYDVATDGNFGNTVAYLQRRELPKETAFDLVRLQRSATQKVRAIRADKNLTPELRAERLQQLETETLAALKSKLGDNDLSTYQSEAGRWLESIRSRNKPN